MTYDEEMEDGRVPRQETPTEPWSQARSDLHQVRSAPKGFRKSRLALPRAPGYEAHTPGQPAILRPKHRVMEIVIAVIACILLIATIKGSE